MFQHNYFRKTSCTLFVNHVIYASPYTDLRAYSSAGERFVDIEEVTGSIPVTPTISPKIIVHTYSATFTGALDISSH